MTLNNNKIDYVHWDDPNELVDRLRLLEVSRQAGHNANGNENIIYYRRVSWSWLDCKLKRGYAIIFSRHRNTNQQRLRQIFVIFCALYHDKKIKRVWKEKSWKVATGRTSRSGEKKFSTRVTVYGYDNLWQADVIEMRPYTWFNKVTFSPLSTCWISTHRPYCSKQKMELRRLQRSQR